MMQMDAANALKSKLDALRPLNQDRIQLLWPQWRAEDALFVYASNAVEGSTLTLGESLVVLEHGVTVSGKPLSDHLDVVNGQKAYSAMLDLAQQRVKIRLESVLDLQRTIVGDVSYGGKLRDPQLVDEMLARYDEGMSNDEHPVRVASMLHFDLLTIHPFKDGTGRTARLLENLHLIREGFVPILIAPKKSYATSTCYSARR
jgi:Fic family protein